MSLNTASFIMKTAVSHNASSVKNTDTQSESAVRIRSAVSVQHQNMMITAVHSEMIQADINVWIVKNLIQHDSSDARQDRSRLRKLNWSTQSDHTDMQMSLRQSVKVFLRHFLVSCQSWKVVQFQLQNSSLLSSTQQTLKCWWTALSSSNDKPCPLTSTEKQAADLQKAHKLHRASTNLSEFLSSWRSLKITRNQINSAYCLRLQQMTWT